MLEYSQTTNGAGDGDSGFDRAAAAREKTKACSSTMQEVNHEDRKRASR